jgi:plasmid rolling circle replication initiator protein Rep
MAALYNKNLDFIKYGDRINGCSGYLKFGVNPDQGKLVLKEVWFCRVRHCPVCQWRRSLRMRAMVYQNIEKIMSEYPSHRWIFLTLTVKNPHVTDLRSTIQEMNTAWKRLTQSKRFSNVVDGFIRTTEVTRPQKKGQEMDAHPHFHAMLLVKSTYFKGTNYINQSEWTEMWRKAMRLDYVPQVHIQAVKPNKKRTDEQNKAKLHDAILETFKYSVKPSDLLAYGDQGAWLHEITRQTHKMRFIASGGVLKGILKSDDEISNEEMISTTEEHVETDETRIGFSYMPQHRRYVYNPKFNVYPE